LTATALTAARVSPRRLRRRFGNLWGYVFILPLLLDFLIFTAAMVVRAVILSFQELKGGKFTFIGLENYAFSLADDMFWNALRNTLVYTVAVVVGGLALSLPLAAFIIGRRPRTQTILKGAVYLPGVVSTVALSMVWLYLYQPLFGLLNFLLQLVGLPAQQWLSSPTLALPSIILMTLVSASGVAVVLLTASMGSIPKDYYDAAMIDGAGAWAQFRHVTVPLVRPVVLYLLVIGFVSHFQVFEQIYVLTNGGPGFPPATETVALRIYNAISTIRLGQAAADSVLLFLFIAAFALFQFRVLKGDVEY
jgi:multiple sugar transport system permease protein